MLNQSSILPGGFSRRIKWRRSGGERRRSGEGGSTLLMVIMVVAILSLGFATYMQSLASYRVIDQQRTYDDKALMAAEAGIAQETGSMTVSAATPITSDTTINLTLATAQFAPFENVTVQVHPQIVNGEGFWTVTATAVADASLMRGAALSRRVQITLCNDNFSKYELFVNNFGPVWTSGYVNFLGLGTVYMGPVNINSGAAFFPGFYALQGLTTAATGGMNSYANWNDYLTGVYGNSAANNQTSILDYWDSTYPTQPYFGTPAALPTVMTEPITLPNSSDNRIANLTNNAGLTLPAGYAGYNASAGPNFVVTLANGSTASNGAIAIQQYLGSDSSGNPILGPTMNTTTTAVNNTMIVQGNIVSLQGVTSGRLSIGATTVSGSMGNIHITGNLEYQSHINDSSFQYPNQNNVINTDGSVNTSYVNTVQSQLSNITDMLGVFAEGDVVIPQKDLSGNPIANNTATPMTVDAIIMATGVSTDSSLPTGYGGGFGVENYLTRPAGQLNFLGGMIQNSNPNMSLYSSSGITNGLALNEFWDKRASEGGQGPPNFPSTGSYTTLANSWYSTYVQNASTPITYGVLP